MSKFFSGFKIKGLRLKQGLLAQDVAASLDITPTYLSLIESGSKIPSKKVLEKAACLFNVTLEDFKESPELLNNFAELTKNIDIANIIALLEISLRNKLKD